MRGLAGRRFEAHFVCVVGAVRHRSSSPHKSPQAQAQAQALARAHPAQARDTLFTLNARVPEARWAEARAGLLAAAASFELLE